MEEDIRDVIKEERHRGRKHILDIEAEKERQALLRNFGALLEKGTEQEFLAAIRALGLKDGSDDFQNARKVWRALRQP